MYACSNNRHALFHLIAKEYIYLLYYTVIFNKKKANCENSPATTKRERISLYMLKGTTYKANN